MSEHLEAKELKHLNLRDKICQFSLNLESKICFFFELQLRKIKMITFFINNF